LGSELGVKKINKNVKPSKLLQIAQEVASSTQVTASYSGSTTRGRRYHDHVYLGNDCVLYLIPTVLAHTVIEYSGRASVGSIFEPTTEHGERRGMYGSSAHQVHTMHADIEWQKRRDRSGTIDK